MTKRQQRPRPICPHCGSADVVAGVRFGRCNRCGKGADTGKFYGYALGGQGAQRLSTDERRGCSDEPPEDWLQRRYLADRRREFLDE